MDKDKRKLTEKELERKKPFAKKHFHSIDFEFQSAILSIGLIQKS